MRFKIYIENSAAVKGRKGKRFFVHILTCPVCRSTVIIIPGPNLPFITTFDSSIGITPTCMPPLTKLVMSANQNENLRFHITLEKVIKIQYFNLSTTYFHVIITKQIILISTAQEIVKRCDLQGSLFKTTGGKKGASC